MNYNFLIIFMTLLCIISMVALLVNKTKSTEGFTCGFDPANAGGSAMESYPGCLVKCGDYAGDAGGNALADCLTLDGGATGCEEKCGEALDGQGPCSFKGGPNNNETLTRCIINELEGDISGQTLTDCVTKCEQNTCRDGCKNFRHYDPRSGTILTGTYTSDIKEYNQYCNSDPANHKYCSPCIEKCLACTSSRCTWVSSASEGEDKIDQFNNHTFRIGAIPEDRSVVIVWNETTSNTNKYLIYIYKKADKKLGDNNTQQTPLMVRTIHKNFTGQGNNSHKITGLTNGVTYSITVNKVSTLIPPTNVNLVKASNTIDVVPSFVNLINFSQLNKDRSLKQEKLKSIGTMDSLRGKKLNFNIT
jgi:hypothetical protein